MAWVKVDDRFTRGPKVTRASFELGGKNARGRVLAVWLDMMSYCNLNTTDGFVPAHEAPTMADADPKAVITAMSFSDERMGPLVESVDGGWQMRNYAEYQPTRADIDAAKQRTASRQKAWRERKSNSVTPPSRDVVSHPPEPNRSEPNRTEPNRSEDLPTPADVESALDVAPLDQQPAQVKPAHPRQHFAPSLVKSPKACMSHAWCSSIVHCVPAFVHADLLKAIGGDAATRESRLKAFYLATEQAHVDGAELPPDAGSYWRAQFKRLTAEVTTQSTKTLPALSRLLLECNLPGGATIWFAGAELVGDALYVRGPALERVKADYLDELERKHGRPLRLLVKDAVSA